jgi:hypothetical protein
VHIHTRRCRVYDHTENNAVDTNYLWYVLVDGKVDTRIHATTLRYHGFVIVLHPSRYF